MYTYMNTNKASYLNFMFPQRKKLRNIEKVKDFIISSPVICDKEIKKECEEIKQLLLNKIDNGLTYQEYIDIKSSIASLSNYDIKENIEIIVDIFRKNNIEIIKIINEETSLKRYNVMLDRKEKIDSDGKKTYETVNREITLGLIFDILKEISRSYISFIDETSNKIYALNNNEIKSLIELANDLIDNEENEYLEIVKKSFAEKFSYLNESKIFKAMYKRFENNLRYELIKILRFKYIKENVNKDKVLTKHLFF